MTDTSGGELAAMRPAEKRAVGVIALIAMLRMFGLFALLPVLSLYAAGLDGATPMLIGLAVGGYGLTQGALQIPLGMLSDRIGRAPVIVSGLLLFALGSAIAATGETIFSVILGRLLQGAGAISATLTALLTDATRDEVRTRSMAILGVGIGGSFMIALIGGPAIAAVYGVRALFWLAAVLAMIAAALLFALPRGIARPLSRQSWSLMPAIRPELLRLDGYIFLLHAILTASFVALPFLFANRLELPVTDHWKLYIGAFLASLLVAVPMIMRDEHEGKTRLIGLAVVLLLSGELVLTFGAFGITPCLLYTSDAADESSSV